jgi:hypothetical protein
MFYHYYSSVFVVVKIVVSFFFFFVRLFVLFVGFLFVSSAEPFGDDNDCDCVFAAANRTTCPSG